MDKRTRRSYSPEFEREAVCGVYEVWMDHVLEMARVAVRCFESTAIELEDRRFIQRWGDWSVLPSRDLSAAVNYYMAGHVAGGALISPDRDLILKRVARKFDACLAPDQERVRDQDWLSDVSFIRSFGHVQLALPAPHSA